MRLKEKSNFQSKSPIHPALRIIPGLFSLIYWEIKLRNTKFDIEINDNDNEINEIRSFEKFWNKVKEKCILNMRFSLFLE
jgi:hypothetical protein